MGNILETFKPDMHAQNQAAQALIQGINKQSENNNNTLNALLAIFENSRRDAREREKNDIEYNKGLSDSWEQGRFTKMLTLKDEKNPDGTPKYTEKQIMEMLDKDKQDYIESQGGYKSGRHADLAEVIAGGIAMGAKKLYDKSIEWGKKGLEKLDEISGANAQNSAPTREMTDEEVQQFSKNLAQNGIQGSSIQGNPLTHLEKDNHSMASQVQSALTNASQNQAKELEASAYKGINEITNPQTNPQTTQPPYNPQGQNLNLNTDKTSKN